MAEAGGIEVLLEKLKEIVEYEEKPECSKKELLYGSFYIKHIKKRKDNIKQIISEYSKQNKLNFVVTVKRYCHEKQCPGHHVDPIIVKDQKESVFINRFPRGLTQSSIYFFSEKNFKRYLQIVSLGDKRTKTKK